MCAVLHEINWVLKIEGIAAESNQGHPTHAPVDPAPAARCLLLWVLHVTTVCGHHLRHQQRLYHRRVCRPLYLLHRHAAAAAACTAAAARAIIAAAPLFLPRHQPHPVLA